MSTAARPAPSTSAGIQPPTPPRTASASHRRYGTGIGAFCPYFPPISSIPAASASAPASTRAGSPGIILTPTNTITLIRSNVTTEIIARRARNSIIAVHGLRNRRFVPGARAAPRRAAWGALVPGRVLDADEAVRNGFVTLEVLREGDDVVRVIEINDVAPGGDEVDRLAVERAALVGIDD